jgi:peroxiredoxin Q/BCP
MMENDFTKRFPVYYDKSKKVNKMLKQEIIPSKYGRMPALLVVDKEGIIKYAYYSDSMDDIPKNKEILEVLSNINN